MDETAFLPSAPQRVNAVPVHLRADDETWVATDMELNQQPEYWSGGHGPYSTPLSTLALDHSSACSPVPETDPATARAPTRTGDPESVVEFEGRAPYLAHV